MRLFIIVIFSNNVGLWEKSFIILALFWVTIPLISHVAKQRLKFKISMMRDHSSTSVQVEFQIAGSGFWPWPAQWGCCPPLTSVGVVGYFYSWFTIWILSRSGFISWYSLLPGIETCKKRFDKIPASLSPTGPFLVTGLHPFFP